MRQLTLINIEETYMSNDYSIIIKHTQTNNNNK